MVHTGGIWPLAVVTRFRIPLSFCISLLFVYLSLQGSGFLFRSVFLFCLCTCRLGRRSGGGYVLFAQRPSGSLGSWRMRSMKSFV